MLLYSAKKIIANIVKGLFGMLRRISDYPDAFVKLSYVASLGSMVSVIVFLFFFYLVRNMFNVQSVTTKRNFRKKLFIALKTTFQNNSFNKFRNSDSLVLSILESLCCARNPSLVFLVLLPFACTQRCFTIKFNSILKNKVNFNKGLKN